MAGNYTFDSTKYLLDGQDIKSTYGVIGIKTSGFFDLPARKKGIEFNWPDEHGLDIDTSDAPYFDARDMQLEVVVKGTSYSDAQGKIKLLLAKFMLAGLRHIKLAGVNGVYMVYAPDKIAFEAMSKTGSDRYLVRSPIHLVEPNPVTRQFSTDQSSLVQVSLDIVSTKSLTINWGDGNLTPVSDSGNFTHDYIQTGAYCIVIFGGVEGIASITPTNATAL